MRPLRALLLVTGLLLAAGCSTVRHDVPRPDSQALDQPLQTALGRAFADQLAATPGQSGFRLLSTGQDAFVARAALADAAQQSLDLQYHSVARDATATMLLYRALQAAQRGVRVRLLIDDLDASGRDPDFAAMATHPNVQVRVFNPFSRRFTSGLARVIDYLGDGARLNRRMHNKLWIADNAAALIGGRNLGNAYFSADGQANFADLDVLAAGPVVQEASRSFDAFWNSEWAVPIEAFTGPARNARPLEQLMAELDASARAFHDSEYAQALRSTDLGRQVGSGEVALTAAAATLLHDPPAKLQAQTPAPTDSVMVRLRGAADATRSELLIVSPYFVPSESGMDLMCALRRRGVQVRVLTNSLASTDVVAVHAGYVRYRARLLACGITLHELRPSVVGPGSVRRVLSSVVSLHGKAIVFDRRSALIGSMNLDPRSRLSNTEIGVLIDSPALGQQLADWFDEAAAPERAFRVELSEPGNPASPLVWTGRDDGQPVRFSGEPLARWWQHLAASLLGLLVPEDLL
ncbi:MAG: phospholipase D family protein [Aquabacterium sp.]|nr:phospholipase D family protein [Aquabacterium sp.]